MFTKMKNIDTAFRSFRTFSILVVAGSILLSCYTVYWSFDHAATGQSKIYVLANGKAIEAFESDRKDNLSVEAKETTIKSFLVDRKSEEGDKKM